jgi:L-amino acid N-acyltransferase YncA
MDMISVRAVSSEIVIRDAVAEDAGAISEIGRQAMPAQYVGLVDAVAVKAAVEQTYAPAAVVDCIARCQGRDNAVFIVAERVGRVIGYLHYDCFGPEPELHRLYLDENERGSGVGGRLMHALTSASALRPRTCFSSSTATIEPFASMSAWAYR